MINERPKHTPQEDAQILINPVTQAARTISAWDDWGKVDALGIVAELKAQVDGVNNGDMQRPEAMLLIQAHTLDALFNELARKAGYQTNMQNLEAFMRMALRAQNQARMTLETLSNIKNPPVIFAKQANVNNGNQQFNRIEPATHAEEIKNQQNKILLGDSHYAGQTLDTRTTGTAIPVNSQLETVDEKHGATIGGG